MWTAGYKFSWRKMEAAAQNRAEDGQEWSMFHPLGATRRNSQCSIRASPPTVARCRYQPGVSAVDKASSAAAARDAFGPVRPSLESPPPIDVNRARVGVGPMPANSSPSVLHRSRRPIVSRDPIHQSSPRPCSLWWRPAPSLAQGIYAAAADAIARPKPLKISHRLYQGIFKDSVDWWGHGAKSARSWGHKEHSGVQTPRPSLCNLCILLNINFSRYEPQIVHLLSTDYRQR